VIQGILPLRKILTTLYQRITKGLCRNSILIYNIRRRRTIQIKLRVFSSA